jgi:hypothetical protein
MARPLERRNDDREIHELASALCGGRVAGERARTAAVSREIDPTTFRI